MTQATWTKLRDGSWGLRVAGMVSPGQVVEATTKAGKREQVTVGQVLWVGQGIALATTSRRGTPSATTSRSRRACVTGGNCSSFGSGRSCGGYDCDGYGG